VFSSADLGDPISLSAVNYWVDGVFILVAVLYGDPRFAIPVLIFDLASYFVLVEIGDPLPFIAAAFGDPLPIIVPLLGDPRFIKEAFDGLKLF